MEWIKWVIKEWLMIKSRSSRFLYEIAISFYSWEDTDKAAWK